MQDFWPIAVGALVTTVLACIRETISKMNNGVEPVFTVEADDFRAAGDIVKFSVKIYDLLKNGDGEPAAVVKEVDIADIGEEIITRNSGKLQTIWNKALKTDSEIRLAAVRGDKGFPTSCKEDTFLKVCIALHCSEVSDTN